MEKIRTIVVQYDRMGGWSDETDGTNSYYGSYYGHGTKFKTVTAALRWIMLRHDPKVYPAHFDPHRWRVVVREEEAYYMPEKFVANYSRRIKAVQSGK